MAAPLTHLPRLEADGLDGAYYVLPDDLTAARTLLVMHRNDAAGDEAAQWARLGRQLADRLGLDLAVFEIRLLERRLRLVDGLVRATMGLGTSADEKARTLVAFADAEKLFTSLGLDRRADAQVALVATDGRVVWGGGGALSAERIEAFEAALREGTDA